MSAVTARPAPLASASSMDRGSLSRESLRAVSPSCCCSMPSSCESTSAPPLLAADPELPCVCGGMGAAHTRVQCGALATITASNSSMLPHHVGMACWRREDSGPVLRAAVATNAQETARVMFA